MNWIEKYKPKKLENIIVDKPVIKQVLDFLEDFKPGKALLLYGPTGSAKTVIIEALAAEKNAVLLRLNPNVGNFKKAIEEFIQAAKSESLFHKNKIVLIDEVDAISGRDRGAIGKILELIESSKFPVFLTANDAYKQKLKKLRDCCKFVKLNKIRSLHIEKILNEICEKEKINAPADILKNLARWSGGDLRSAITDLEMISKGGKKIDEKSLESLGYRERETPIFEVLKIIFRSKNINAAEKAINTSNLDPDFIFWWIETNLEKEFSLTDTPRTYELLSKADVFRKLVMKQQNWRFKKFMIDLMAGVSLARTDARYDFVNYKPPDRIMQLSRTKFKRALLNDLCLKIGKRAHCSKKIVKTEYIPYFGDKLKEMDE